MRFALKRTPFGPHASAPYSYLSLFTAAFTYHCLAFGSGALLVRLSPLASRRPRPTYTECSMTDAHTLHPSLGGVFVALTWRKKSIYPSNTHS